MPLCACGKHASYGVEGTKKALYCFTHAPTGMVNVKSKKCCQEGCKKQPTYNIEGSTIAINCSEHATNEMIDVRNPKCFYTGCTIKPSFNAAGIKRPLYCAKHKKDGMIDVINKTCCHDGCRTLPVFNYLSEVSAKYCLKHALKGMVNIVNKRRCCHEGCTTRPSFNTEGCKFPLYCANHKQEGMINVLSKRCNHEGCTTLPSFNAEGCNQPLYCAKHKQEGMIDVTHKTCKSSWCHTIVQQTNHEGYCLNCFIHLFPDKPISRNYKTKERAVVDAVKAKHPSLSWVTDKPIQHGCSKRRPDILLDLGYTVLIIEIDENQHTDYDCSCENRRIMELSQDVGHRPLVFIRFNPDDYDSGGKRITSCWGINKLGFSVVKKTKQSEWNTRLDALLSQIDYWTNPANTTDKTVEVVQLFYDQ